MATIKPGKPQTGRALQPGMRDKLKMLERRMEKKRGGPENRFSFQLLDPSLKGKLGSPPKSQAERLADAYANREMKHRLNPALKPTK